MSLEYPHSELADRFNNERRVDKEPSKIMMKDGTSNPFVYSLFSLLADYKEYPKFQFERRVDAILSMYFKDIFLHALGWIIEVVAPEFPLKHGDNYNPSNIDYCLFRRKTHASPQAWVFLEIKTDEDSVTDKQLQRYLSDQKKGVGKIVSELRDIVEHSTQPYKYNQILKEIRKYPTDCDLELVYLVPDSVIEKKRNTNDSIHWVTFGQLRNMKPRIFGEEWEIFKKLLMPSLSK